MDSIVPRALNVVKIVHLLDVYNSDIGLLYAAYKLFDLICLLASNKSEIFQLL